MLFRTSAKKDDDGSSDEEAEAGPTSGALLALMGQMSATLNLVTERLAAGAGGTSDQRQRELELHPRLTVPVYTGYDDFLEELEVYIRASCASEHHVLHRILPLALQAGARQWWAQQPAFSSIADFRSAFRERFESRIQRQLERHTQHPEEGLVKYIRAMQALYNRAGDGRTHRSSMPPPFPRVSAWAHLRQRGRPRSRCARRTGAAPGQSEY